MEGLMMHDQLTIHMFFNRSQKLYRDKTITSYFEDGSSHSYTFADFHVRVRKLANLLVRLGVKQGDRYEELRNEGSSTEPLIACSRVGTFGFNHHHHLELYFAITMMGAVLHTINVRLFEEQLAWIINHAEDKLVFVDSAMFQIAENLLPHLKTVQQYVVMGSRSGTTSSGRYLHIDDMLEHMPDTFTFPNFSENTAFGLCYTSGTTGNPKGVLYSHRSTVLAAYSTAFANAFRLTDADTILLVVPMFHAHAWGYPFSAIMNGADIVLPGRDLAPAVLMKHILKHRVTFSAGVPTIWLGILDELRKARKNDPNSVPKSLAPLRLVSGGSACPPYLFDAYEKEFGVEMIHAWGMTETSPLGTIGLVKHSLRNLSAEEKLQVRAKQGVMLNGIDLRIVDQFGTELPHDGAAVGDLQVRGPYVVRAYFKGDGTSSFTGDGWFNTGDVASIDEYGYMKIVDRSKDLIKSGGEWISSVDVENALMSHPKVAEASVFAVPHPKFMERPLAIVIPHKQHEESITKQELFQHLGTKVAKWWIPDDLVFLKEIPKTSVGKFDKKKMRVQHENHYMKTAKL